MHVYIIIHYIHMLYIFISKLYPYELFPTTESEHFWEDSGRPRTLRLLRDERRVASSAPYTV